MTLRIVGSLFDIQTGYLLNKSHICNRYTYFLRDANCYQLKSIVLINETY
jgi:hypothetical protein